MRGVERAAHQADALAGRPVRQADRHARRAREIPVGDGSSEGAPRRPRAAEANDPDPTLRPLAPLPMRRYSLWRRLRNAPAPERIAQRLESDSARVTPVQNQLRPAPFSASSRARASTLPWPAASRYQSAA